MRLGYTMRVAEVRRLSDARPSPVRFCQSLSGDVTELIMCAGRQRTRRLHKGCCSDVSSVEHNITVQQREAVTEQRCCVAVGLCVREGCISGLAGKAAATATTVQTTHTHSHGRQQIATAINNHNATLNNNQQDSNPDSRALQTYIRIVFAFNRSLASIAIEQSCVPLVSDSAAAARGVLCRGMT